MNKKQQPYQRKYKLVAYDLKLEERGFFDYQWVVKDKITVTLRAKDATEAEFKAVKLSGRLYAKVVEIEDDK